MQNKEIAAYAMRCLLEEGADQAACTYTRSEKNELSLESGRLNLLRTTFDNKLSLKVIKNNCVGSLSINKTDPPSIARAVKETLEFANSGQPDVAHDIAPNQGVHEFTHGNITPDVDGMIKRVQEFQDATETTYPEVLLEMVVLDHTKTETYTLNSNGTDLAETKGNYYLSVVFTSRKNGVSGSFNYDMVCLRNLDTPILQTGQYNTLLRQSTESVHARPAHEKFVGDVIITPQAMNSFLEPYLRSLRDAQMIAGASVFKDKLGERIAHDSLTVTSNPVAPEITDQSYVTADAYRAKNLCIIDKGVLQTYLLSLYGANKTNLNNQPNDGDRLCVKPGDSELRDMIKSIDKGLLLCRYSGGTPSSNGEFSGVAKNSFYIENGVIQFPVQEVMVSGNMFEGFNNIVNLSSERHDSGYSLYPWIQVKGWTISGS